MKSRTPRTLETKKKKWFHKLDRARDKKARALLAVPQAAPQLLIPVDRVVELHGGISCEVAELPEVRRLADLNQKTRRNQTGREEGREPEDLRNKRLVEIGALAKNLYIQYVHTVRSIYRYYHTQKAPQPASDFQKPPRPMFQESVRPWIVYVHK